MIWVTSPLFILEKVIFENYIIIRIQTNINLIYTGKPWDLNIKNTCL